MNKLSHKCQNFVIEFLTEQGSKLPITTKGILLQIPILIRKNGFGNVMYFLKKKHPEIYKEFFLEWYLLCKLLKKPDEFEDKLRFTGKMDWYIETQEMSALAADYLKEIYQEQL